MALIAALPMYTAGPQTNAALWQGLRVVLNHAGVDGVPDQSSAAADLLAHWLQPDLLLSQTCGYPLTHALAGKVQLVGAFHYAAAGCEGASYRSMVIARADDTRASLADFSAARIAYNSLDSQSGYHSLRHLLKPLASAGRFGGQWLASGAHRASIAMVRAGQADVAAIDCVTLALLQRHEPQQVTGIRIIAQTAAAPGLPLITSARTTPDQLAALRAGLAAAITDPQLANAFAAFGITRFEVIPLKAYDVIPAMEAASTLRAA